MLSLTPSERLDALQQSCEHRVEYIVVGGVGAVLQGVPLVTFDVEIVYSTSPENLENLLAALVSLDTTYRDLAGRRIIPTISHLEAAGHNLFKTKHGLLDVLGR